MRLTLFVATLVALALSGMSARAAPTLIFEPKTGKIIYAHELDRPWHPASLTKIMTAYLTFEAVRDGKLKLDQKIPYSKEARLERGSRLRLRVGEELTVDSALKALIIKSANDVSVQIAEAVAGSTALFVAKMNNKAEELGMSRTNFVNPNGMPAAQQITTARDMAILSQAALRDFPEHAAYWSMEEAVVGKRKKKIASHNRVLKYVGGDGIKTGFICDSGYNVVGSATRDGRQLAVVVLGSRSSKARNLRAARLLEHGFDSYDWKELFGMQTIESAPMGTKVPVASIRNKVRVCGGGPRKVSKKKKGKKKKKYKKKKSNKKK